MLAPKKMLITSCFFSLLLVLSPILALAQLKNKNPENDFVAYFDKQKTEVSLSNKTKIFRKFNEQGFITEIKMDQNNDNKFDTVLLYDEQGLNLIEYKFDKNFDAKWDETLNCSKILAKISSSKHNINTKDSFDCISHLDIDLDGKMDVAYNRTTKKQIILNQKVFNKIKYDYVFNKKNKTKNEFSNFDINIPQYLRKLDSNEKRAVAAIPGAEAGLPLYMFGTCKEDKCIKEQGLFLLQALPKWKTMVEESLYYSEISANTKLSKEEKAKLNDRYSQFKRTKFDVLIHESCEAGDKLSGKKNFVAMSAYEVVSTMFQGMVDGAYNYDVDSNTGPDNLSHHFPVMTKYFGSNHPDNMPKIVCTDTFDVVDLKATISNYTCRDFGSNYKKGIEIVPISDKCKDVNDKSCKGFPAPAMYLSVDLKKKCDKEDIKEIIYEFNNTLAHEMLHSMGYESRDILNNPDVPVLEYAYACSMAFFPQVYGLNEDQESMLGAEGTGHCKLNTDDLIIEKDEVMCDLYNFCKFGQIHGPEYDRVKDCNKININERECSIIY